MGASLTPVIIIHILVCAKQMITVSPENLSVTRRLGSGFVFMSQQNDMTIVQMVSALRDHNWVHFAHRL